MGLVVVNIRSFVFFLSFPLSHPSTVLFQCFLLHLFFNSRSVNLSHRSSSPGGLLAESDDEMKSLTYE